MDSLEIFSILEVSGISTIVFRDSHYSIFLNGDLAESLDGTAMEWLIEIWKSKNFTTKPRHTLNTRPRHYST